MTFEPSNVDPHLWDQAQHIVQWRKSLLYFCTLLPLLRLLWYGYFPTQPWYIDIMPTASEDKIVNMRPLWLTIGRGIILIIRFIRLYVAGPSAVLKVYRKLSGAKIEKQ